MARTADTPQAQKAKGNPGRRTKAMAARDERIQRAADLLAPVGDGAEVAPPSYLLEAGFQLALQVWKRLAPELKRTHRLPAESHGTFAQYCVYFGEWLECQIDINEFGRSQTVKTTVGGKMERDRPSIRHRQSAFDNTIKLAEQFGLTPRHMYSLFKDQAMAAQNNPGLFDNGGDTPKKSPVETELPIAAALGPLGSATRHKSQPPLN